ncbi:MAG: HlyD family efflux transporter periplasmic adaptor subunit [Clostridia bacterium]|nr:HlyD family efflux transporter periplasmic adaptor subunit [Clostridia bacterium]
MAKKRKIKKLLLWLILLLIAALLVRITVWPKLTAATTVTYDKYTARTGTISNALSFSGSVSVKNYETFTADNAATVRQIFVKEEQKVKKDEKLMRLSDGTNVKASFDGQVNAISVEVGDEVGANANLIQIVDFNNMTVSLRVNEYDISDVHVGQACRVTVTALNETFDSTISHINRISSSMGNTAYYTVTAELTVTDNVLPGMQATVTIPQEEAVDSIILSQSALSFAPDNSAYVLMYDENQQLKQVPVELGISNDSYIEITAGLANGDEVYKQSTASSSSGGLFGAFGSFSGGGMPGMGTTNNFGGGNMRNNYGGGTRNNYGGGTRNNYGGSGGFGGGMR